MKKAFAFFTLLLGCVAMFAQSGPTFPYQAVVRNSQNQLIKDSTFAVDVAIYQGATLKFSETQSVTTNANGQFTMNIGGGAVVSGAMNNVTDWSVAKFKLTYHLSEGDIVSENAVSPVPYALQAANAIGTISGNFLTSDSAVITTMQSEIAALQAASLDCNDVKNCIADTLSAYTPTNQLCYAVKDCDFSNNSSIAALLQTLSDKIDAQNNKIDSLAHIVDSLSNLNPDTPDTPTGPFTCGTSKVKDVDNNEYNTVAIGNQCWMKENLRTNVGTGDYGYPTGVSGTADTVTYGRLYSWAAVMNGASASSDVPSGVRGICPEGWHVPSDGEWGNLINYVKGNAEYVCGDDANNIANALSSEAGWTNGSTPGCNAGDSNDKRNQTGFSAVPAGYFDTNSTNKGTKAYFWSTTNSNTVGYYKYMDNTSSSMNPGFEFSEEMGLSVRCLRN